MFVSAFCVPASVSASCGTPDGPFIPVEGISPPVRFVVFVVGGAVTAPIVRATGLDLASTPTTITADGITCELIQSVSDGEPPQTFCSATFPAPLRVGHWKLEVRSEEGVALDSSVSVEATTDATPTVANWAVDEVVHLTASSCQDEATQVVIR